MGRSRGRWRTLAGWVAGGLLVAALVQQLRRPAESRSWHGRVLGVPYDFRVPTVDRLRARMWSPGDPQLLTPQVVGLGWTLNVGRLVRLAVRGAQAS